MINIRFIVSIVIGIAAAVVISLLIRGAAYLPFIIGIPLTISTLIFLTVLKPRIAVYIWCYTVLFAVLNSIYVSLTVGMLYDPFDRMLFILVIMLGGWCAFGVQKSVEWVHSR